ncbi:hypothetical protein ACFQ88_03955 [Paenibacillus sp. NPDC056579]|uniref:hypothetical protein n=1 Tax=Paenibacillus sp. NPDC056579 TaxID=3345871 RepID=UPI003683D40A
MRNKQPKVIAIAAVSGGGKTTTVKELLNRLPNSKALYFDDYDFDGVPDDVCDWVEQGSDYNAWNLQPLIEDVERSLAEQGLDYIILDYPFAYMHHGMSRYIHYTVYIDTPLDVAMARRIMRNFADSPMDELQVDMKGYLSRGRFAYLEMLNTIKPNSDYIIDGCLPVDTIVKQVLEKVK